MKAVPLEALADLPVWRDLQGRIADATALRFGLWDEEANRVLAPAMLPPSCQYVLSEPDRRERCEQFHGAIRAEVRRLRRPTCATCPFGVEYMAVPIAGSGLISGHWEGGYVVVPGPPSRPDASLDAPTWFAALAVTPHRTRVEIDAALALLGALHHPLLDTAALRERRRDQVVQLVGFELGRMLDATRALDRTLDAVLALIAGVLAAPVAAVLLRGSDDEWLLPIAWSAADAAPAPRAVAAGSLWEGTLVRALAEGQPVLVSDRGAHSPGLEPLTRARCLLAVPMTVDGTTAGVLVLGSFAPRAFNGDDLGLATCLTALVEGVLQRDQRVELAAADDPVAALVDAACDRSLRTLPGP